MTLCYNPKNEFAATRDQLALVPTPPPIGRFHRPLPYGEYVEQVIESLNVHGWEVTHDEYAVRKDGARFFGLLELAPREGEYISAKDWALQIGVRGSHDQSLPRGLTFGSRVFVCSNLCFHGDLARIETKQTLNINERLPRLINGAIGQLEHVAQHNVQRFDRYHQTDLNPRQGDAALVELHRRDALSGAQLARAIREWDNPSFEDHAEDGHNVWRLFNAATEALKPGKSESGNLDLVRRRSVRLTSFLDEVVGL